MSKDTTKLNITLSTNIINKIKEGDYNRNKLIIGLLKKHIDKKKNN